MYALASATATPRSWDREKAEIECPEDEAERVKALLAEEMEGVYALAVPLTAEAHSGKNWLEAK